LLWLATIIVHKICEGVKDDIKKIIMSEYAFTSRRLLFFGEYKFKRGNAKLRWIFSVLVSIGELEYNIQ
jgi:hypothetical protein